MNKCPHTVEQLFLHKSTLFDNEFTNHILCLVKTRVIYYHQMKGCGTVAMSYFYNNNNEACCESNKTSESRFG